MASFPTRRTRNYPEGVGVGVESGERGGGECKYQVLSQVPSKYQVLLQVPSKYQVLMQIPSKYQVLWQIPSTYANTKQVPSTLASTEYFGKYQASTKYFCKFSKFFANIEASRRPIVTGKTPFDPKFSPESFYGQSDAERAKISCITILFASVCGFFQVLSFCSELFLLGPAR